MGHKVNPYGFRLGVIYPWKSNWFARRDYSDQLHEDVWIRKHIRSRLSRAGISSIDIERKGDQIWVYIRTARPGIVIGRKGAEVDRIRKDIERVTKKRVDVKVEDMNSAASEARPETDATLLAQGVAEQLAGRVSFRRAMRRAVQTAMRSGALGVRVQCGGRLGGAEMSRREWYREGRVPLTRSGEDRFRHGRGQDDVRPDRGEGVGLPRRRDPAGRAGDRAPARPRARAGLERRSSTGALITDEREAAEVAAPEPETRAPAFEGGPEADPTDAPWTPSHGRGRRRVSERRLFGAGERSRARPMPPMRSPRSLKDAARRGRGPCRRGRTKENG